MELTDRRVQSVEQGVVRAEFTLRGILVLIGSALAYFTTVGFFNAYGVLQEYYHSEVLQNESPFRISWIGSFDTFAIFACAAPAGILADKVGPTIPMVIGSIILLVALFMIALCKQYWQFFLAQGLLLGVGMSFIAVPASGTVPRFFIRNRAVATGISVTGSSLGGMIWPIVMDRLFFKTSLSFGWSIRIVAFTMIPLLAIAVLTARMQGTASDEKGEAGGETDGVPDLDGSFLRRPPFILLCFGLALCSFGLFTPFFYTSTYAITRGMSQSLSFYTLTAINVGSALGRILPGFVADRFGKFNILASSAVAASIVAFCWTSATSTAGIFVWATIYGLTSGGILSLEIAAASSLAPAKMITTAVGVCFGSTALTQLFGPPISGQILTHSYKSVSIWCGAVLLAGCFCLLGARLCVDRRIFARI